MRIIDDIKINTFYPELRKLNIDDEVVKDILSNKNFKLQYKTNIKPFIKYLREYKYSEYDNGSLKQLGLDNNTINQHLNAVFRLSIKNNADKYITFIKQEYCEREKITDFRVFNDLNFDELYSMIGLNIFDEKIANIISNGNSERLIQFIKSNPRISLSQIDLLFFDNKVWTTLSQNPTFGNTTVLETFKSNLGILVELINKNLFEGIKYTYENIPESHSFIKSLGGRKESVQQFSMHFIKNLGDDTLKKLYCHDLFYSSEDYEKIFKIADLGNYELIRDIANYDLYNEKYKYIKSEDYEKSILEIFPRVEVFLAKYFGIEKSDAEYIKIFLVSINKLKNPSDEFIEKYGEIIQILNKVFASSGDELVEISKYIALEKKEEYQKLIYSCELAGNEILKKEFARDLKNKNIEMISIINSKKEKSSTSKEIDIYEFTGQPFTMLVHTIINNNLSNNNDVGKKIRENPEVWEQTADGNNYLSTSLITERYMKLYGFDFNNNYNLNDVVIYGFNEIPASNIKYTSVTDAGVKRDLSPEITVNMREFLNVKVNTITTVDHFMEETIAYNAGGKTSTPWNEILLLRDGLKPNYILCFDKISETSRRAAEYFNVPIYLVNSRCYSQFNNIKNVENIETKMDSEILKR